MARKMQNYDIGIFSGVAALAIFLVAIFVATQYATSFQNWYTTNEHFSWTTMAISNLGVSSVAFQFTLVILVVSLLIVKFSLMLKDAYGGPRIQKGTSLIIYGYIALMATFIVLLYQPNSTPTIAAHFATAIVYFILPPIGIILIGREFLARKNAWLGYSSILLGTLAFIFGPIVCFGSSIIFGNKGVAIPELLQILSEGAWMFIFTVDMLKLRHKR